MKRFFTLRTIIDDILLTYRNNNISESEDLSRAQIEQWIHGYRAMLIKQDLDKGRDVNPTYVQTMDDLELMEIPHVESPQHSTCTRYRTVKPIPKPIDLHNGIGIISVTDLHDSTIQHMSRTRAHWQKYRKYTSKDYTWFYEPEHLFVDGYGPLKYIKIRMIAEDPTQLGLDQDEPYPLPVDKLPALKALIMEKELGVMLSLPSDDKNSNSLAGLKPQNNE